MILFNDPNHPDGVSLGIVGPTINPTLLLIPCEADGFIYDGEKYTDPEKLFQNIKKTIRVKTLTSVEGAEEAEEEKATQVLSPELQEFVGTQHYVATVTNASVAKRWVQDYGERFPNQNFCIIFQGNCMKK